MRIFKLKNHIKYIPFIFFVCLGCSNKTNIEYYPNGNIKQYSLLKGNKQYRKDILFFENGNVKGISNYENNLKEGEQLNFYEGTGSLESKIIFKKGIPNGVAYWFYESGALRASRNYVEGKEEYVGFDYWDDKIVTNKSLERFDDSGRVYYKLNFDSIGNPTYSEGDSLHSGVERIK